MQMNAIYKSNNSKLSKNAGNVKSLREFKYADMEGNDNFSFVNKKGQNSFSPPPINEQQV